MPKLQSRNVTSDRHRGIHGLSDDVGELCFAKRASGHSFLVTGAMAHLAVMGPYDDRREQRPLGHLPGFHYMPDVMTTHAAGLVSQMSVEASFAHSRRRGDTPVPLFVGGFEFLPKRSKDFNFDQILRPPGSAFHSNEVIESSDFDGQPIQVLFRGNAI